MPSSNTRVAIACQGGGSHAAYAAGVLRGLLPELKSHAREYSLMGLSGTSGGAHCALITWYWMLKDGDKKGWGFGSAIGKLDEFWERNAPQDVFEQTWNSTLLLAGLLPMELSLTPSYPPLSTAETLLGLWPRKEFVDLGVLLRRLVNFEEIRVIGDFQKIAAEVRRLKYAHAAASLPFASGDLARTAAELELLKERCAEARRAVLDLEGFERCKELVAGADDAIQGIQTADIGTALARADQVMQDLAASIPFLLLGAVNVSDGTFKAFDSRKGEISMEAVLASAAVPWIFKAVTLDGNPPYYWDGLFSQNPPTKDFVAGIDDRNRKPDEIWVIQINPQGMDGEPVWADQIQDRRNELTGNLSLNQEIDFLKSVNKWIFDGSMEETKRKFVHIHWIRMHSPTLEKQVGPLSAASKANRSRSFVDALAGHGVEQSALFWPVRKLLEEVWNAAPGAVGDRRSSRALDEILSPDCTISLPESIGVKGTGTSSATTIWTGLQSPRGVAEIKELVKKYRGTFISGLRVLVDGMDIVPTPGETGTGVVRAQWRAHLRIGALRVTLTGKTELRLSSGRLVSGEIKPIDIEEIEPLRPLMVVTLPGPTARPRNRTGETTA